MLINFVKLLHHVSPYPAETSLDPRQKLRDTLRIVNTEDGSAFHLPGDTKIQYFVNYLCINLFKHLK